MKTTDDPRFDELLALTKVILDETLRLYEELDNINKLWREYYKGEKFRIRMVIEENEEDLLEECNNDG